MSTRQHFNGFWTGFYETAWPNWYEAQTTFSDRGSMYLVVISGRLFMQRSNSVAKLTKRGDTAQVVSKAFFKQGVCWINWIIRPSDSIAIGHFGTNPIGFHQVLVEKQDVKAERMTKNRQKIAKICYFAHVYLDDDVINSAIFATLRPHSFW